MEPVDVRGRFVWHQLLTRDVPGARKFYPTLTGWDAKPWPMDPEYTVCVAGDAPAAGMTAMAPEFPADVPSHWMQYIGTRDVDATAEAAVLAGGFIVRQPSDMKGAGRYAVLADPQGAVFAVIDPENARAEGRGVPPLGHFSWHELATTDNEAAFAFYSNLFGWDAIRRMDMGPLGVYLTFGYHGEEKGGMYIKPADMPAPAHWLPYVHVPDVDAAVSVIEAGGGKIMMPPMEVPGGSRITVLQDPSGAAIALHSYPVAGGAAAKPASKPAKPAKPEASIKSRPKAKAKPKANAKSPAKPKGKAKPKAKAKVKAKVKGKTKGKAKSAARKTARKTSVKTKAKSRTKASRRKK
jgi:uncharacterized protein